MLDLFVELNVFYNYLFFQCILLFSYFLGKKTAEN